MQKKRIRQSQLLMRRRLTEEQRCEAGHRVQRRLLRHDLFATAQVIALYAPIRGEVETCQLLDAALIAGKRVVYPCVEGEQMVFVVVHSRQDLTLGSFGVLEPCGGDVVPAGEIDLVVVPGLAFDRCGARLGYGKGYYDRAFEGRPSSCVLVGLGYAFQLGACLPCEAHDVSLDWLVTDQEMLSFDL
ncbi:MAG: 5-formyltetrahydrofolate cyclo-ligase [Thermodesulfobacteriota bacterium]|nr:5-formyltetrahydrofolate cyclo-ligase [Thermodesulfobacteriota bacterium]